MHEARSAGDSARRGDGGAGQLLPDAWFALSGTLLLVGGGARGRAFRATRRVEASHLAIAMVSLGCSMWLNVSWVIRWLDLRVWHLDDLTVLLSQLCGLVTAGAAIELVARASGRTRLTARRARAAALVVVSLCLIAAFVRAQPLVETPEFFDRYAHDSALAAYWILFIVTLLLGSGYVAVVAQRTTRHDNVSLRRGLRLISYGAASAFLFLLTRVVGVVGVLPRWADEAGLTLLVVGGILIAVGVSLPELATRREQRRAHRQLQALWSAATEHYPHVRASAQPSSAYRMIIEIHDALSEARARGQVTGTLMTALDALPARAADQQALVIGDLRRVADSVLSDN